MSSHSYNRAKWVLKYGQSKGCCRVTKKASGTFLQFKDMEANTSSNYRMYETMEIKGCDTYILFCMLFSNILFV